MSGISGLRVLLVEDEALIAMMAEDMLDAMGCTNVTVASNVTEALAALENGALFDVAMLDVNLNGERSMPVADRARARGVPYVFTTGYGADGVDAAHADAPVLAKPYVLADLEATLARCASR
jgi:CheY-like chemotaxis protein